MTTSIRHPRLYAYQRSKVLSSLCVVIVCSLLSAGYAHTLVWPVAVAAAAFAVFVAYSVWFWVRKPPSIVVNYWLSSMSTLFTLYFLIVAAMMPDNPWWYIFPTLCGAVTIIIAITRRHDVTFAFRL